MTYYATKRKEDHTGMRRITGYSDKCVAMTQPKAASGARPVYRQNMNCLIFNVN